jgi:hypothetical protein
MPQIPDPRMNQIERLLGIIEVEGDFYCYTKDSKSNPKRCMPFEFTINEDLTIVPLPKNQQFEWNGHDITHRCVIPAGLVLQSVPEQGPITRKIFEYLRGLQQNNEWPDYESELPDEDPEDSDG